MKKTRGLVSLVGLAAIVLAASATLAGDKNVTKAKLGEPAPTFVLTDSKGQERDLADYEGKIVVIEWINPDCPYVVNCYQSKAMQGAYQQAKRLSKDIVWLAVNTTYSTSAAQNNMWIDKFSLKYPILLDTDGAVGKRYDARRTPHMFVIDREGVLRYSGAIDNNKMMDKSGDDITNYVANAIRQIVEGETVAPDYVKPYGCSVKYKR